MSSVIDERAKGARRTWTAAFSALCLAVISVLVPTAASADDTPADESESLTEWVCQIEPWRSTDFALDTGTEANFTIEKFDSSLGDFLRAEVKATVGVRARGTIDLTHEGVSPFNIRDVAHVWLNLPPNEVLPYPTGDASRELYLSFDHQILSGMHGAGSIEVPDYLNEAEDSFSSTDESVWVGEGDHSVTLQTLTARTASGGGGNYAIDVLTDATAEICYRYAYLEAAEPELVSIGDYVWVDVDRDGQQNDGNPVQGVVVNLYAADGTTLLGSTTTNEAGFYSFGDLLPSTDYVVEFEKPDGYHFTEQNVGSDVSDSDADPVSGRVSVTTPSSGGNSLTAPDDSTIDAGLVQYNLKLTKQLTTAGPFVPGMTVTYKLVPSNDGPADALAGWSVTDILPGSLTFVSMTSESDQYTIDDQTATSDLPLPAGESAPSLTITATIGGTFAGEAKNVAYIAPSDDDVDETNPLDVPDLNTDTETSETDNDAEASLSVSLVSIGDAVWWDTNRDGLQGDDEPVVPGVTVNLYKDGVEAGTTQTDSEGYYWFTDLLPGAEYTVEFVKPTGTTFTTQDAGEITSNDPAGDANDSDADPATGKVTFTTPTTGENQGGKLVTDNPGIDAGLIMYNLKLTKALITSEVVYKGDTVTFELIPSNDGPVDALAGWSVTDILPPELEFVSMSSDSDEYTIEGQTATSSKTLPAGATAAAITVEARVIENLTGSVKNVAYVAPSDDDAEETIPLGPPPTNETDTSETPTDNDAEAPVLITSLVSIGDYVWIDVNRDGQQNDGNPVADVVVNLYAADGTTLLDSTITSETGFYSFGDLYPDTDYVVEFVTPEGHHFTDQNTGEDVSDSDADRVTGRVEVTTPESGANSLTAPDDPTIDAGLVTFNLVLTKELVSNGPFYQGSTVVFELTPSNEGPADALGGWSVAELPEAGLEIVSIDGGDAYTCDLEGLACVNEATLPAGASAPVITVTAVVAEDYVGDLHNVAYVVPAEGDVPETNPLEVPEDALVNTDETPTDNDDSAKITVDSLVSVGDYVWWDHDRDGTQGESEPPVADVVVNLYDESGELLKSTTTDDDGYYFFDDLVPGTPYTIGFVAPGGAFFTTPDAGEDDAIDSDVDVVTGRVDFVAEPDGLNLTGPNETDNPTIDAGLVQYNLVLEKELASTGVIRPGAEVQFTVTPRNEGPSTALAGWSISDLVPAGTTLVSGTGDGYSWDGTRWIAEAPLAGGETGPVLTVIVTVDADAKGSYKNIAYVAPSPEDGPETNPLEVPDPDTDTKESVTDNDSEAPFEVTPESELEKTGAQLPLVAVGASSLLLLLGFLLLATRRRMTS